MEKPELTIVEQLEADASVAKAALEVAQKDLAAVTADRDAKAAELEALKASAASAVAENGAIAEELATAKTALETSKADTQAAVELATKAEARAKLAEGALARDPEALKQMNLAGTIPVAGAMAAGDGRDPQTWDEALKACGGDYVVARKRFPAAWASQFKK